MARKEAHLLLIDTSESMGHQMQSLEGRLASRFEVARDAAWQFLARKAITGRKTVEVGVVAFGTDESSNSLLEVSEEAYANIVELTQLGQVTLDDIKVVRDLEQSSVAGDLLSGLVVAISMLGRHIGKRKIEANLYVLTDAASPVNDVDQLDEIGRQLSDQNISLTVVGFDFTEESELQVKADESQGAEQIKPQNEMMLRSMVDSLDGTYIDGVQFYQQMCALTKEPAKPQVLKVPFEITPKLVVQAQYLSLISSLKKPTLKKYHPTNPSDRASTDRTYLDSRGEEVEFVERAKAYVYGKELVPVQEDDLEVMKLQEDSSTVPRWHCMSSSLAVVAQRDCPASANVLAALTEALQEEKKVAIVRFVRKKGANPELGVLVPDVSDPERPYLVYNKLPFFEDYRDYAFSSFKHPARKEYAPSSEQKEAALALVDSLTIHSEPQLRLVPNPELAAVWKLVVDRAFTPDCEVTLPPETLLEPLQPDPQLFKNAAPAVDKFKQHFKFKVVEKKTKDKHRTWADYCEHYEQSSEAEEQRKRARADEEVTTNGPATVSSTRPEEDFEAMLSFGRVEEAMSSMQAIIVKTLGMAEEQGGSSYHKALSCIKALRAGAAKQHMGRDFNDFLLELKRKHCNRAAREASPGTSFFDDIQAVKPITSREDSTTGVSKEEADGFWGREEVKEEKQEEEVAVAPDRVTQGFVGELEEF